MTYKIKNRKMEFPESGKIQQEFLEETVLPLCGAKREEVIVGPGFGVDVAVVRLPHGNAMVSTCDPISLIPTLGLKESAWLSVHLMASDIATSGLPPMFAIFNLNLPPHLSAVDFQIYWSHISRFCEELGTAIIGGHTGRFEGQNSTVAGSGTMFSYGPEDQILTSRNARPGNDLIVTREAAIVSTSILCHSFPNKIGHDLGEEILEQGKNLFYQSSSVKAALAAARVGKGTEAVTAMHDVTEGGVCGAIFEMAEASGCGVEIWGPTIPLGKAQREVCRLFDINPLYSIGAGSLIIACHPDKSQDVISALAKENVPATIVGRLKEKRQGKNIIEDGKKSKLVHPGEDPYWSAFYEAFKQGWN